MSKPVKIGVITRREYEWLKSFESLEPHEIKKIEEYEKQQKTETYKIPEEPKKEKPEPIIITKGMVWNGFKRTFYEMNGRKFDETSDAIKNIAILIQYFIYDEDFFKSDRLVKNLNDPSFKKGLLIIGKFGNGKTAYMNALSKYFKDNKMPMVFKSVTSHQMVTEWETIESPGDKSLYFEKYLCKSLYIDDVKKEKIAHNFGKTNVIKEILEKRYDKKLKTFITCNYTEGDSKGDLRSALYDFSNYGDHIYDRLFEMFNIIEFKGKSFRK